MICSNVGGITGSSGLSVGCELNVCVSPGAGEAIILMSWHLETECGR